MKTVFLLLSYLALAAPTDAAAMSITVESAKSANEGGFPTPIKRNLVQFGAMVLCETKRNPLDYIGYGCHCGFGGKGTPVDEIDRCCHVHDQCYDNIIEKKICPSEIGVYVDVYNREDCTRCAEISNIGNSRCEKELCECDATAARCFKKYDSKFQDRYKKYDKSSC